MRTNYVEVVKSSEKEVRLGKDLYEHKDDYTFFRKGFELEEWKVDMMFRMSVRKWYVKVDFLSDGSKHMVVLGKVYPNNLKRS